MQLGWIVSAGLASDDCCIRIAGFMMPEGHIQQLLDALLVGIIDLMIALDRLHQRAIPRVNRVAALFAVFAVGTIACATLGTEQAVPSVFVVGCAACIDAGNLRHNRPN